MQKLLFRPFVEAADRLLLQGRYGGRGRGEVVVDSGALMRSDHVTGASTPDCVAGARRRPKATLGQGTQSQKEGGAALTAD